MRGGWERAHHSWARSPQTVQCGRAWRWRERQRERERDCYRCAVFFLILCVLLRIPAVLPCCIVLCHPRCLLPSALLPPGGHRCATRCLACRVPPLHTEAAQQTHLQAADVVRRSQLESAEEDVEKGAPAEGRPGGVCEREQQTRQRAMSATAVGLSCIRGSSSVERRRWGSGDTI